MASTAELKRYLKERIKVTASGCWEWQLCRVKGGYGHCRVGAKAVTAHRLAYTLWRGTIGRGLVIRHTCHNPPCCNPKHLIPGTHEDNIADIVNRKKPRRVLSPAEVVRAMEMRREGETVNNIATALNTTFYLIQGVVKGMPGRPVGRPKGSKNFRVRFTDEIISQMKALYMSGKFTQKQLGEKYKCSQDYVSLLVRRSP